MREGLVIGGSRKFLSSIWSYVPNRSEQQPQTTK